MSHFNGLIDMSLQNIPGTATRNLSCNTKFIVNNLEVKSTVYNGTCTILTRSTEIKQLKLTSFYLPLKVFDLPQHVFGLIRPIDLQCSSMCKLIDKSANSSDIG